MAEQSYDVVVVGSGPGGYVAAIRAAQLGFKTACVEKRATLGGTCLNVGCIPSKALLAASEHYDAAKNHLGGFGVKVSGVELDLPGMMAHKDKTVAANVGGVEFLFKKNKIDWLKGAASFAGPGTLTITDDKGGTSTVTAKNIIIATGSDVAPLPGIEIDETQIVSSTGGIALSSVPKKLVVIGAGVIGLEIGSVWQRLGSEVIVLEYLDRILPGMDGELAKTAQRTLTKQGLTFKLATKVTSAKAGKKGVTLTFEPAAGGAAETLEADIVLVAVGRRPYVDGLNLEAGGVQLDERKRIKTDAQFRTSAPNVYAIGDVIVGPMLAHKAEDEGSAVAEIIAGQHPHIDYDAIPGVVYTWPEIAAVGATEEQLKEKGVAYKVGKFPFTANGRARAMLATDGFVKVLADATTDRVLGCHIIGPEAGTIIAEVVLAMEFGGSSEDIARACHAHPTLNEALKEAALGVEGRAVHI